MCLQNIICSFVNDTKANISCINNCNYVSLLHRVLHMKKRVLIALLAFFTASIAAYAGGKEDGTLRKSRFNATFPQPFTNFPALNNANNSRPNNSVHSVSTGYYIVDSDDDAGDFWRPNLDRAFLNRLNDTEPSEIIKWKQISTGPLQSFDGTEGRPFSVIPETQLILPTMPLRVRLKLDSHSF